MKYTTPTFSLMGLVALAIVLAVAAVPVCGQTTSRSVNLYGQAGLAYPFGSLDNHSNLGLQGSLGVGFVPIRQASDLEFIFRAEYANFHRRDDHRESIRFLTGRFGLKLNLGNDDRRNPYLLLGAGYGRVTLTPGASSTRVRTSENDLLACAGLGLEIGRAGKMRWLLEAMFTDVSGTAIKDYQFLTLSLGLRL